MNSLYTTSKNQEIERYNRDINIHNLPPIYHYWSSNFLTPIIEQLGFSSINDIFIHYIQKIYENKTIKIISIGSGNCDYEINIGKILITKKIKFKFTCLDVNETMLSRGRELAQNQGLIADYIFLKKDLNIWRANNKKYDVVIANHSLHHILNLESLFEEVNHSLKNNGVFLINDMIGRNGHMRWPEALSYIDKIWKNLDKKYKYNHQFKEYQINYINWDCSKEGFEGVRAQDILRLLVTNFNFAFFIGFANIITPFIDRGFGWNYDINNKQDLSIIYKIAKQDQTLIERGILKPTQMIGVLQKKSTKVQKTIQYKNLSPKYCIRNTSIIDKIKQKLIFT